MINHRAAVQVHRRATGVSKRRQTRRAITKDRRPTQLNIKRRATRIRQSTLEPKNAICCIHRALVVNHLAKHTGTARRQQHCRAGGVRQSIHRRIIQDAGSVGGIVKSRTKRRRAIRNRDQALVGEQPGDAGNCV